MADRLRITLRNGSTITGIGDGVALQSAVHPGPRPRWYDRFVMWFKPRTKMRPESLEEMEIEIRGR